MPIDASIPLQAKFTPPNPLEMVGQFGAAANALAQNKLIGNANQQFGAEFGARQAIGQIAQASIDPDTGKFDPVKFNKLLGSTPAAGFSAPEALASSQARQGEQLTQNGQMIKLAKDLNDLTGDIAGKLLAMPEGSLTPDAVVSAMGSYKPLLDQMPPPLQKTAMAQIAQEVQGLPGDEAGIRNYLRQEMVKASARSQQIASIYGTPSAVDTGPSVQVENINPETKTVEPMGAPITKAPAPALVDTGPTIQPITGDTATGGIKPVGPVIAKDLTPGEASAPTQTFQGGQPGTKPRAELKAGSGFNPTGPHLGESEGAAVTGAANAQQGVELQRRADKVNDTKALLGNMEGQLGKFSPGPQSPFWKTMGQLGAEYGVKLPGAPPKDAVAAQEEFGKLGFQLAQTQFQALGGTGTDAKLDSTMHTSPSELISREGSKGIMALLKGNEDAIAAKARAWQSWLDAGHGPTTYGKFQSQFNRIYDPRVFQFQYLPQADQQRALTGMTSAEKTAFQHAQARAKQLGWTP